MSLSRFAASTIAYGVVVTVVATLWHESVFGFLYYPFNIYSAAQAPVIWIAAVGSFVEGAVLSYLVGRYRSNESGIAFGVVMGVLLCVFASSYDVFQTAALEDVQGAGRAAFMAVELAAMLVYGVVGGAVVGIIHSKR